MAEEMRVDHQRIRRGLNQSMFLIRRRELRDLREIFARRSFSNPSLR
jgi:hypothetical protein